jgi:hypothetical protein
VAKQVQKEFDYNNEKMAKYWAEECKMEKFFDGTKVCYVNQDVGHLAWIASSKAPTPSDIILEKLSKPSVKAA